MKGKMKVCISFVVTLLTISMLFAVFPMANCAGAITLTPSSQAQGGTVTVAGSGFAATQAVGIGIGQEVVVTGEAHPIPSPTGLGPFITKVNHWPIKPGSFSFHCVVSSDTNVVESDYTDNGDGTLASTSTYSVGHTVNYVTGAFGRGTNSAWDGFTVVFTASYTYYQYNVTPAAGITTSAAGAFSADIVVPAALANANTPVNAFDVKGNRGTATLTVNSAIPEGFSMGIIVVLSAAVVIGTVLMRKLPKSRILAPTKVI